MKYSWIPESNKLVKSGQLVASKLMLKSANKQRSKSLEYLSKQQNKEACSIRKSLIEVCRRRSVKCNKHGRPSNSTNC